MSELFLPPFNLAAGATIAARVVARNAIGSPDITSATASSSGQTVITPPAEAPVVSRNSGTTTTTVCGLSWSAISSGGNGGSTVTGYELLLRQNDGTYTKVADVALPGGDPTAAVSATYSTGISAAVTYHFKVRAINAFSVAASRGALSADVPVIASAVPATLAAVTTANVGTNVVISWAAASNVPPNAAVTAYRIKIIGSDGQPYEEATGTYCNGANYGVWVNRQCTIPMSVLIAGQYTLAADALVQATVVAINGAGESTASALNTDTSGAKVKKIPQTPPTLAQGAATSDA
jgi:hypothetical protein